MRNERGAKRSGRTGRSTSTGKPSFKKEGDRKSGGYKKSTGPKKINSGFKKERDHSEKKFSNDKPSFKTGFKKRSSDDSRIKKDGETRKFSKDKPAFKTGAKKPSRFSDSSKGDKSWTKDGEEKGDKKFTPKKSGSFKDYRKKGSDSSFEERKEYKRKTGIKTYTDKKDGDKTYTKSTEIVRKRDGSKGFKKTKVYTKTDNDGDGLVRLNKFIANAGICSRREADTYIQTGVVTVNGTIVTELGYKVKPEDKVLFHDKPIIGEKHVYILLNKPKDYITTSKDPQNRKTVYDLVNGIKERVFPVGRLDRNTTGVLLMTNDGLLAEKLMHPRKGITKIYHVEVDKKFAAPDMAHLRKGVELEDGFFTPDEVDYVEGMDKHHIGISIHSGANRIVRRLFEALDYKVVKLDRVVYGGLTKKGLTRGKWRFLKDTEVYALKMM